MIPYFIFGFIAGTLFGAVALIVLIVLIADKVDKHK